MTFLEKAKIVHGNKYDYSLIEYKNNYTKIKIICPIHGIFEQVPYAHTSNKSGCPKCGLEKSSKKQRMSYEKFINKAKIVHGDKYDYRFVKYLGNKDKVCILCKLHGEFWQSPNNHLKGCGCPKCSNNDRISSNEYINKFLSMKEPSRELIINLIDKIEIFEDKTINIKVSFS